MGKTATYTKSRQSLAGISFQEFALPRNSFKPLTDVLVKNMKPGMVATDVGDYQGLRISRTKTGVTRIFYRYRSPLPGNGMREITLGYYPSMSLAEARAELIQLKAMRKSGVCPAAEKKAAESRRRAEAERQAAKASLAAFSVAQMVEAYLAEYIEDKKALDGSVVRPGARKPKGQDEVRRTLYGDAVRVLGERPAADVSSKEVFDLIMEVVDRGANVQAGCVLRELKAAFDYCIGDQLPDDFVNPCYQASGQLKRKRIRLNSKRGQRVLSDAELAQLLSWIPGSAFTPTQKSVLLLTLMTGCRTGEVCNARWKDIDLDSGTWHLRETETGVPRNVQLSRQAVEYLRQLKRVTGKYVCASQKTGAPILQKSLTEQMWHMRQRGVLIDLPRWTPHDLRRSVRTGLARIGCPSEVAEAVLGHSKSDIEGTYNLHSYDPQCREWLQKWCDHLDAILLPHKGGECDERKRKKRIRIRRKSSSST